MKEGREVRMMPISREKLEWENCNTAAKDPRESHTPFEERLKIRRSHIQEELDAIQEILATLPRNPDAERLQFLMQKINL